MVDDFRHRVTVERDHGRAAFHRIDHDEAERLGPFDREPQRLRTREELGLLLLVDFAEEFDVRPRQQRRDRVLEVFLVSFVYLRGDL